MKYANCIIAVVMAASSVIAAPGGKTPADNSVTNRVTDAELLTMIRSQYERDMTSDAGRIKWHGNITAQNVDTNIEGKVTTYASGKTFTEKFCTVKPIDQVKAANKLKDKLPRAKLKNPIPPSLQKKRDQRDALPPSGTNEVTVVLTAGKGIK